MQYYPVYLNLEGRHAVVVGPVDETLSRALAEAEEKTEALLDAGADVTFIAPLLPEGLRTHVEAGRLTYRARSFRRGDLADAFLALSATDDPAINERVWNEANARNIIVNSVDDVPHCSFILPSIVRQGDLIVAISTAGNAPALGVRLRQRLERELGHEYARFLELAGSIREPLAQKYPAFTERKERWYRLVDSDVLALLREGDEAAARRRFAEIMGVEPEARSNGHATNGHGGRS